MRMKVLIALLLMLLIAATAHAQDATVEPTAEMSGMSHDATPEATDHAEGAADEHEDEATEGAPADEADHEGEAVAGAAESADEGETPAGTALLMLLLGVGVVVLVGAATIFRGRNTPPQA
jgi:hypothetical protein